MNKRQFLSLAAFGLGTLSGNIPTMARNAKKVETAGTLFEWSHMDGRLHGQLSAPTDGWIAVGFNNKPSLRNTRFVIAVTSGKSVYAEEHIALVPQHKNVTELGFPETLADVSGFYQQSRSHLSFSLPHQISAHTQSRQHALSLAAKSNVHLMLAWSRAPNFEHHSAWRKHFNITL